MSSVGDAVRFAREQKKMSARALSLEAGLSASYVSKVESGSIDPSLKAFAKIVKILGLTRNEVLVLIGEAVNE